MRSKFLSILVAVLLLPATFLRASTPFTNPDEGMWLLSLLKDLNIQQMQKMGLELSAEDLYDPNGPSLKDAVVQFGGFCTGEFVSASGLVFTNHHCGYDAIASVSSVENNHLDNGFWAKNYSEEKPIEGLYVQILSKMFDITDSVAPFVASLDQAERMVKVREITGRIKLREEEKTGQAVDVKSMFYGNKYYIFYYDTYNDVRLVGTAPQSVGKFGGDTDNWMWPRHTGDFSVFRVYADKINNPAEFSTANVPYKPKKYLKISLEGVEENDFTMIMGFPGQTERYLTSYAMNEVITESNPAQINVFKAVTDAQKEEMDKSDVVRLQLSPDYASLMNALKLWDGQIEGMTKVMDAVAIKQKEEVAFTQWLNKQNSTIKNKYGTVLDDLKNDYATLSTVNEEFLTKIYAVSLLPTGNYAIELSSLEEVLSTEGVDEEAKKAGIEAAKTSAAGVWETYNYDAEMKKVMNLLNLMNTKLPADKKPQALKDILANTKGTTDEEKIKTWTMNAFMRSVITTPTKLETFLAEPSVKKLQKDKLYNLYIDLYTEAMILQPVYAQSQQNINKHTREYIAAQMLMYPDKAFYPDANSTMRFTYGTVQDYAPKDGVQYNYLTTDKGIEQKYVDGNEEFDVPDQLLNMLMKNDFGRYADKNGDLPVCFLSNNDITGGNSGSPVLDKKGNLIGIAFDGNYEGTPGDYIIDPNMNRTISVDIRYVLFIIDKLGGAKNIIKELEIVE
ncbi:MAG: S46 family peptidase [Fimbriimonadaceae bacterium]|nr:S46 family peptidase [Chitinophagales bacterium]